VTPGPAGIDLLPKPPRSLPSPGFALDVVDGVVAYRLHWDGNPLRPKRHPRGKFRFDAPRDGAEYAVTYANLTRRSNRAEDAEARRPDRDVQAVRDDDAVEPSAPSVVPGR
jgi:hypothetical protein